MFNSSRRKLKNNAPASPREIIAMPDGFASLESEIASISAAKYGTKNEPALAKADTSHTHETLLVLDGDTEQNAVPQVKVFDDARQLTGFVLTKLDGSTKSGVLCTIAKECRVRLKVISIGKDIDGLQPFAAKEFVEALAGN